MAKKRKTKTFRSAKATQIAPVKGDSICLPQGSYEIPGWEDYDDVEREVLMADSPSTKSSPFKSFEVAVMAVALTTKEGGGASQDFIQRVEHNFPIAARLLSSAKKYLFLEAQRAAIQATERFERHHDFTAPKQPGWIDFEYLLEEVVKSTSTSPGRTRSGFTSRKGLEKAVRRIWKHAPKTAETIIKSQRMTSDQHKELMRPENRRFRSSDMVP